MKDILLSNKLKTNYDNYYDGESQWRWLGALDKVKNIVDLCSKYPHEKTLEIGSGEGSILKRLYIIIISLLANNAVLFDRFLLIDGL